MSVDITVTQVEAHEIPEAASVMAHAFCNSPCYNFILTNFEESSDRVEVLEWIFRRNMQLLLDRCPSICKCARVATGANQNKIVATMMITDKEHEQIDTWTLIRYGGALQLPFRLGWTGLRNLLMTIDDFEKAWSEIMESLPTKYDTWINVERMTVVPDYQGKGIGSAALKQCLDELQGLVRLATQEERNVKFYERLGFKVVAERDFGVQGNMYHSWFLVKEPS